MIEDVPVSARSAAQGDAGAQRATKAFWRAGFQEFFRKQVREAIRKHRMFTPDQEVLVAVSGGKDGSPRCGTC